MILSHSAGYVALPDDPARHHYNRTGSKNTEKSYE